jgi:hydroxymethylbilane synthase
VQGHNLWFYGLILRPDGSQVFEARRSGDRAEAATLGADAGMELKGRAPPDFFVHE